MSEVSQTWAPRRIGFGLQFALAMAGVVAIIALAMGPVSGALLSAAGEPRLHGPDMAVWARLSLPIRIHILTALAALALGAVLMMVRKGRTFHRIAGWAWVMLVSATAGATLFITSLNQGSWSLLHLFTAGTLVVLPLGVLAARRHKVAQHRGRMMGLFYGGFAINLAIAFLPGRSLWAMFFG